MHDVVASKWNSGGVITNEIPFFSHANYWHRCRGLLLPSPLPPAPPPRKTPRAQRSLNPSEVPSQTRNPRDRGPPPGHTGSLPNHVLHTTHKPLHHPSIGVQPQTTYRTSLRQAKLHTLLHIRLRFKQRHASVVRNAPFALRALRDLSQHDRRPTSTPGLSSNVGPRTARWWTASCGALPSASVDTGTARSWSEPGKRGNPPWDHSRDDGVQLA